MSDRNRKIVRVVIFIVVVLGICFGGIVAVDLLMPKEGVEDAPIPSNNPSPTISPLPSEEPLEEKEVSMELADKLYNMIKTDNCGTGFYPHYGKNTIFANDFTNKEKNAIVITNLIEKEKTMGQVQGKISKYTKQQIIEMKNLIFGTDADFDIIEGKECYQFDLEKDGYYVANVNGCSDICIANELHQFMNAIQKGNKIYFDQVIIFIDYVYDANGSTIAYYGDWEKTKLLYKKSSDSVDDIRLDEYQNQASVYRYTYQDNGNNTYTFLEMERIR